MSMDERSAWILMERIYPPTSLGYLIRPRTPYDQDDTPKLVKMVSELGIFGACIG